MHAMEGLTPITASRFEEGMTVQEYLAAWQQQEENEANLKAKFTYNLTNFVPEPQDVDFFATQTTVSKVLVLTGERCGDVVRYVPSLIRLTQALPQWEVRFFDRNHNPDLADLWKKGGQFQAIPVIAFFDKEFNELACFIEKPQLVYSAEAAGLQAFARAHPELEDAAYPMNLMSRETLQLCLAYMRSFCTNNTRLWQQYFIDELKSKLSQFCISCSMI